MSDQNGLPIEQFIQALTSQLDRAQNTLALKARVGMPLTFAVKDISIDLRSHVEMIDSVVRIRPAGPADEEASTIHLALTTITRPMIEENTMALASAPDEPSLKEVLGKEMTDEERRRLEWAGIHTVSQLREMHKQGGEEAVGRLVDIPVMRLRAALARASGPFITHVAAESLGDGNGSHLLRIRGQSLMQDQTPQVHINGEAAAVVQASEREVVVAALPKHTAGTLTLETAPGVVATKDFSLGHSRPASNIASEEIV